MNEFIRSTVEYQQWGWNAVCIGSIGTVVFTFIEGWGLWKQNQTIWRGLSGTSVSVSWLSYSLFSVAAFFFYGMHTRSIAVLFHGAFLTVVYIPVVLGLWRYKGFSPWERVQFFLFALMVPAMALLPWKKATFLVISVGAVYSLATEPFELWKTRLPGVVDGRFLVACIASTTFWIIYAFAIGDWALEALASVNVLLLSVSLALWCLYRHRELIRAGAPQRS